VPKASGSTLSEAKRHRIEAIATMLDSRFAIPGTSIRFGVDGLLGLIPGIGDMVSASLSSYFFYEAHKIGARKRVYWKMLWNTLLDTSIGAIPVFGDVFDVWFKANKKNAALLLKELEHQQSDSDNAQNSTNKTANLVSL